MPQINNTESERMAKRQNRILYADFLSQQNDYANGLAPAPPVLNSRYGLYNQLTLGRLETTPTEQTARSVLIILPPPVLSSSSIRPSATDTSVTLTLPRSNSVTSYTYVVRNSAGVPLVPQPTTTGDAAATGQVTFSPLTPGTEYSVVVTSTGPSGTNVSAPLPIYTLPTTPSGFSASLPTTSGATLSWSGGSGATSYDYIITDSTNNQVKGFSVTDTGSSGSSTFSGLNPGSRYTITVIPRNPSGIPSSPPATFLINTAPAAPPAPTANGSTTDGFSIALTSSVGAATTKYFVDGVLVTTTSSPVKYETIGDDVVFTGVTPGAHTVRVTSVSLTGVESHGVEATIYTRPVAPLSSTFSVVSTSPSVFTLSWTGTTGATAYSYMIKANGVQIANPTITDNGAAGNAVFSNLSPGVTYSVEVIATNPATPPNTATSSSVTAFTAPNAAAGITQTAGTDTSATISWTGAAGATSYLYSVKDASQNTVGSATTASTLLGATITGLTAGKKYDVIVTARSANGSTPSSVTSVYTAPSKPTGLFQSSSTTTSITMAWYNGLGATSYVYTLGADTAVPSSDNGVTSQTIIFTGLTPGQTYTPITVTARIVVHSSLTLSSASDTYTTAGTSPAAPTFLASPIGGLTSTGFTLSWNAGSGAGAYTHALSLSAGGVSVLGAAPGPRVSSSTANSVTFTGLTPGTVYYPSITAAISGVPGTSTSSPSSVTTASAPAAPVETNTPSSTITSKGVTIGFTPVAGMTYSYKVDGATAAAITSLTPHAMTPSYYLSPSPLVAGQPATVQFTGMSSGAGHFVSIVATDAGGTSSPLYRFPSTGTFNTAAAPATPTETAAATSTQTSVTLTLPTPPAGVTYSYSVSGGSPSVVLSPQPVPTISVNAYTFSGLTAGTSYTVTVTATDSAGATSTYSSTKSTTSPPPAVPTKAATPVSGVTSKGFTVNWNAVPGANSYNYSINTGDSSAQGITQNTKSTSFTFTGLTPGTSYRVQVKSVGSGGINETPLTFTESTLAAPTAITVSTSSITSTGFTVTWTGGTSPVAGNTITYSTVATSTSGTTVPVTGASPAAFTGLTAAMAYTIVVTATDSAGTTSTGSATATTTSNIPAAPVITVESALITTSGFTVKFPVITGATSYIYYLRNNKTNVDTTGVIPQPTTNLYMPVTFNITSLTDILYTIYVKTNNGQESLASNTVSVILLQRDTVTRITANISLNTPSGNVAPSGSGSVEIANFVLGESETKFYLNCSYWKQPTGLKFTQTGSAIFSYTWTTNTFVKLAEVSSDTLSWSSLAYYNTKLYMCDTTGNILSLNTTGTPEAPSIYASLPTRTSAINIDASGNLYCVANKKIFKISIPTSPTPNELFTLTGSFSTVDSPYVSCDPSGNLYFVNTNISSSTRYVMKIPYTNGTYGSPTPWFSFNSRILHSSSDKLYVSVSTTTSTTGFFYNTFVFTNNALTKPLNIGYVAEVWPNSSQTIMYYTDNQSLNAVRIA